MSSHVYFKGLKFIRFFAASMVVIHHIEQYKDIFGLQNYWTNGIIRSLGDKGVTLFFVLSGFLITFLLLKEKEETKSINIKYFYIRRILRIWSLYFLIVLSSIFIFPYFSFFRSDATSIIDNNFIYILLLSITILPNVTLFKFGAVPFSSQAWSIGVEEQFYLFWPLLIKYIKNLYLTLISIIIVLFVLQNCGVITIKLFGKEFIATEKLLQIAYFFKLFRIDCMAFGSIGALLVFHKSKWLRYLYNPLSSLLALVITLILILNPIKIYFFDNIIYSVLFMVFIINVASYDKCFYAIENKFFDKLGDISYGMYMYHPMICFVVLKIIGNQFNNLIIYSLIFSLTILVSYLSYILFEKRLIKIKSVKFSVINNN